MIPTDCEQALSHPLFAQIVRAESSGNPFAIGGVAGRLLRQPAHRDEAVATAQALHAADRNYSVGLAQVNRVHFGRLGWNHDLRKAFDRCDNARAGAEIFNRCYSRALRSATHRGFATGGTGRNPAIEAALSCYYSGDLVTGIRLGYVARVLGGSAPPPGRSGLGHASSMVPSFNE